MATERGVQVTEGGSHTWRLERVVVVGTSGAGKSTFAQRLGAGAGLEVTHLDDLHWLPGWTERDPTDLRTRVAEVAAGERWVVDGNYAVVRDILWPRATTVVWLDYSLPVVLARAVRRTVRRVARREVVVGGNVETFSHAFLSLDSIPLWVLRTHHGNRRMYRSLQGDGSHPHLEWIRLASPAEAERFLGRLTSPAAGR